MISRRSLLVAAGAGALGCPAALFAQQPAKIPRIGYLSIRDVMAQFRSFMQGMVELGYTEGKNLIVERRSANGNPERLPALVAELIRLNLDVLVALDPPSFEAALRATRTTPVVIRSSGDPVGEGTVASLAHPGGNVTGVYSLYSELNGKRLELLKEAFPAASRVMLLVNSQRSGELERLQVVADAARKLGMHALPAHANKPEDFETAFKNAARENANCLLVLRSPLIVSNMAQIVRLALQARLPAVYDDAAYAEAGGPMSYGASLREIYHRAAYFVDKILKGAKAGDIPMEQPTKFELVVNMKSIRALGIKLPNSIRVRIDRVIE